jgi:hypothetical protein
MPEANLDFAEWPLLPSGIQPDGHGHSGAERGQEQVVRIWATVRSALRYRFVGNELVTAGRNLLH